MLIGSIEIVERSKSCLDFVPWVKRTKGIGNCSKLTFPLFTTIHVQLQLKKHDLFFHHLVCLFHFLALAPCAHLEGFHCYGDCLNLGGSFYCQCPKETYGDPFAKDGCTEVKKSLTGDKCCFRLINLLSCIFCICIITTLHLLCYILQYKLLLESRTC